MPETFRLKSVRNGALLSAEDLPGLPPIAVAYMLRLQGQPDKLKDNSAIVELAVELSYWSLRSLEPKLTREQLMETEDFDSVAACFRAIQERNPSAFPKASKAPAVAPDPPGARSEPNSLPSAPPAI